MALWNLPEGLFIWNTVAIHPLLTFEPGLPDFLIPFTKNRESGPRVVFRACGCRLFSGRRIGIAFAYLPSRCKNRELQPKGVGTFMWKVKRVEERGRIVLRLIGRLEGDQLSELEDAFASEIAIQSLILDLEEVRLVDHDAVRFLADCEARGAELQNCPAYIREWIAAEKASRESTLN